MLEIIMWLIILAIVLALLGKMAAVKWIGHVILFLAKAYVTIILIVVIGVIILIRFFNKK